MKAYYSLFATLALSAAAAQPALASTVYNQPINYVAAYNSTAGGSYQAYDNFALTSTTNVNGATWQGFTYSELGDQFTVSFYSDNAGTPGTQIASLNVGNADETATGSIAYGLFRIYSYSASFSPVALAGSTQYWVSIQDVTANANGASYFWETGSGGDGQMYQNGNYPQPNVQPYDLAFSLQGVPGTIVAPTPEPSSLMLLGTGVLGAIGVVRRRWAKA